MIENSAPKGLREVFYDLLVRLNPSWTGYWIIAAVLFLCFLGMALFSGRKQPSGEIATSPRGEVLFFISIFLFLFAVRWPGFMQFQLNPDESFCIAGAMKLLVDPIYWHSFVGMTHGPLIHYPLILPGLAGLAPDYFSTRVIGILILALTFYVSYRAISFFFGIRIGRVAIVPGVAVVSLFTHFDFAAYNGEHVTLLLLSLGLYLTAKLYGCKDSDLYLNSLVAGIVLGSVPFAKVQGIPAAAFSGLLAYGVLWVRLRRRVPEFFSAAGFLTAGALTVTAVTALLIWAFGEFEEFWISYILQNVSYSGRNPVPFSAKLSGFFNMLSSAPHEISAFSLGQGVWIAIASLGLLFTFKKGRPGLPFALSAIALVFVLIAAFSAALPGNNFFHYLLFVVPPLVMFSGTLLGVLLARTPSGTFLFKGVVTAYLLVTCIAPGGWMISRLPRPSPRVTDIAPSLNESTVARVVRSVSLPADSMAVWGWADYFYLQTGLYSATRYASAFLQQVPNPYQSHFRERFLSDLRTSSPPIFIDVVSPNQFMFTDRAVDGHDTQPEFAAFIKRGYIPLVDIEGTRIYVRRNRARKLHDLWNRSPELSSALAAQLRSIDPPLAEAFVSEVDSRIEAQRKAGEALTYFRVADSILKRYVKDAKLSKPAFEFLFSKALIESRVSLRSGPP